MKVAALATLVIALSLIPALSHDAPSDLTCPRPSVSGLLTCGRPSAISRLVMSTVIDPINAPAGGALSHILQKTGKAGLSIFTKPPSVTDSYATSAVILKLWHIPIVATTNHGLPDAMQSRPARAVRSIFERRHFSPIASARDGSPGEKVHTEDNSGSPTITLTLPSDKTAPGGEREIAQSKSRPPTESLASQISSLHTKPPITYIHTAPSGTLYPPICCSPDDNRQLCHAIDCDEIGQDAHGLYRWRNLTFERQKVFSTFDSQCHVCNSWDWQDGQKHPTYGFCLMIRNSVDKGAAIKWTAMYDSWRRRDTGK